MLRGYVCVYIGLAQNRILTPYMTVYLVISLPKIPYIHRIYMVLANPRNVVMRQSHQSPAHVIPRLAHEQLQNISIWVQLCPVGT